MDRKLTNRALAPSEAETAPLCTICVANFDGADVVLDCLESVYAQRCDFAFEVIVHDDCSNDASVALLRERFPAARVIESATNVGFCVSNNRMVAAARGRYVLLLNNDAVLLPDALETLRDLAENLGRPAILGLPQYDAGTGALIDRGSDLDLFFNPIPRLTHTDRDVGMVIGACLWIPRETWIALGGFPEWLHTLAEDMYLCAVARLRGIPVRVAASAGFRHWVGHSLGGGKVVATGLDTTRKRRRLSERNKLCVMVVALPQPWLALVLPVHVSLLLIEGALLALIKLAPWILRDIYVGALAGAWSLRAELRRARRVHQDAAVSRAGFLAPTRLFPHKLRLLLRHGLPTIRR